jgi:hypothetical protein
VADRGKLARLAPALLLAAAIWAGCGGDDDGDDQGGDQDPNTAITVRFADEIAVIGSREAWGDALEQQIESGAISCEPAAKGRETCTSDETSTQADWVPEGLISLRVPPG